MEVSKCTSRIAHSPPTIDHDYQTFRGIPTSMDQLEHLAENNTSKKFSCLGFILTPFRTFYKFISWLLSCCCCCPTRMSEVEILNRLKEMKLVLEKFNQFDAQSHYIDLYRSLPKKIQADLLEIAVETTLRALEGDRETSIDSFVIADGNNSIRATIDDDLLEIIARDNLWDISQKIADDILNKYIKNFERQLSEKNG